MRVFGALPLLACLSGLSGCSGAEDAPETALGAPAPVVHVWARAEVERDLALRVERLTSEPFQQGSDPKLQVVLSNRSSERAYPIVLASDGSEMGWREPHAWFDLAVRGAAEAFHAPPLVQYMRCGNYDEAWQKDVRLLEPGQSVVMPFMPFYFERELDLASEVRIIARYAYGDQARDARQVPPALHVMPAYALQAPALVLPIERPLALELELLGPLPRTAAEPLSRVFSVTARNVSRRSVPFTTNRGALTLEMQLEGEAPGSRMTYLDIADGPWSAEASADLAPGTSRSVLDEASQAVAGWDPTPSDRVRRIRARLFTGEQGNVAVSPWIDVARQDSSPQGAIKPAP